MNPADVEEGFVVCGVDRAPNGPVELPTLVNWVKDEGVTADTWVYDEKTQSWQLASQVPELRMFFQPKAASVLTTNAIATPSTLRVPPDRKAIYPSHASAHTACRLLTCCGSITPVKSELPPSRYGRGTVCAAVSLKHRAAA